MFRTSMIAPAERLRVGALACAVLVACSTGTTPAVGDGGATEGGSSVDAGPGDDGGGGPRCTPGGFVFCRCSNRDEGTKMCRADGQSFDPCTPCP